MLLIFASITLGFGMALAQCLKSGVANAISSVGSIALLPGIVLSLYILYSGIGWWAALFFVVTGVCAGAINGVGMRKNGRLFLLSMQPFYSAVFLAGGVTCAILQFFWR